MERFFGPIAAWMKRSIDAYEESYWARAAGVAAFAAAYGLFTWAQGNFEWREVIRFAITIKATTALLELKGGYFLRWNQRRKNRRIPPPTLEQQHLAAATHRNGNR